MRGAHVSSPRIAGAMPIADMLCVRRIGILLADLPTAVLLNGQCYFCGHSQID